MVETAANSNHRTTLPDAVGGFVKAHVVSDRGFHRVSTIACRGCESGGWLL
jgi:hypothetical protein